MSNAYLTNHFLIAMPQLQDPNFEQTVTLICEHNADGALGLVINRPLDISFEDVFEQLCIQQPNSSNNYKFADEPILMGGPVALEQGFIIHKIDSNKTKSEQDWGADIQVSKDIRVTTSKNILEAIAQGKGPEHKEFALGYSGWEAGQLESELLANSWLTVPYNEDILFNTPYSQRWDAAANLIGLDLSKLSGDYGHA